MLFRSIEFGKKWAQKIARFFADVQKEIGKPKREIDPAFSHEEALTFLADWALPTITKAIKDGLPKLERRRIFHEFIDGAAEKLQEQVESGKWK